MCFTSLIVPVTIFGSMLKARRIDSGNAAPNAAAPMARRIVRRSVFSICLVPESSKDGSKLVALRYAFVLEALKIEAPSDADPRHHSRYSHALVVTGDFQSEPTTRLLCLHGKFRHETLANSGGSGVEQRAALRTNHRAGIHIEYHLILSRRQR